MGVSSCPCSSYFYDGLMQVEKEVFSAGFPGLLFINCIKHFLFLWLSFDRSRICSFISFLLFLWRVVSSINLTLGFSLSLQATLESHHFQVPHFSFLWVSGKTLFTFLFPLPIYFVLVFHVLFDLCCRKFYFEREVILLWGRGSHSFEVKIKTA